MLHRLTVSGRIEAGKLVIDRARLAAELAQMPDGPVEVRVGPVTRSQQQSRFYWGVVLATLSEHTGYRPEELHELMKAKFNTRTVSEADEAGDIVDVEEWSGSTTALSTPAFSRYVDAIRTWAATELGCVIPDPSGPS